MVVERWEILEQLFEQALELPVGERSGFLDSVCEDDPELRRQIDRLLAADDEISEFMESPAVLDHAQRLELFSPADQGLATGSEALEHIKLLGKGGMGSVYLARQASPIERLVAVKYIRADSVGPEAELRFRAEQQALARMSHPNIAQVFDAGISGEGRHFLIMEYVPGIPLTRYCDDHRLSLAERLELFADVCAGVEHLHQKAVIHRDLKPSNVLVTETDGRPTPKIIDFGIAKSLDRPLTDETLETRGGVVGTPSYMSPESILSTAGPVDVDTRTDVYSLGVLLHEILVGVLPARSSDSLEGLRASLDTPPMAPSAGLSSLVETQASQVAQQRRSTSAGLRRALRQELDWIVLKALAVDRAQRYPSAGAVSMVVLALSLGLYSRAVEAERANLEAERANRQAAKAQRENQTTQEVVRFLVNMFNSSDPERRDVSETMTVRELLDRGTQAIETELAGEPLIQAKMMNTVGLVYCRLGLIDICRQLSEEALSLRRLHSASEDVELARSLDQMARVFLLQEEFDQGESLVREALRIKSALFQEHESEVIASQEILASIYLDRGQYSEAEKILRRIVENAEVHGVPKGRDLALIHQHLSNAAGARGLNDQAEAYQRQALDLILSEVGPEHPEIASAQYQLGVTIMNLGRPDEAEPLIQQALEVWQKTLEPHHTNLGQALHSLAMMARARGEYSGAKEMETRAIEIFTTAHGPSYSLLARSHNNLAIIEQSLGNLATAKSHYQQAISIWRSALGQRHPLVAAGLNNLAALQMDSGELDQAERALTEALAIQTETLGANSPYRGHPISGLGRVRRLQGRSEEAAEFYKQALAIWRQHDYQHREVALVEQTLSRLEEN